MSRKSLSNFFEKTGTYINMTPTEQKIVHRKKNSAGGKAGSNKAKQNKTKSS